MKKKIETQHIPIMKKEMELTTGYTVIDQINLQQGEMTLAN